MKIDEAINILKQYIDYDNADVPDFYTMEEACKVVIKTLEQEPLEVEAANLQKVYNKGFEDCRQAVLDVVEREEFKGDTLSEIEKLPPVTPQPKVGQWEWNQYDANPKIGNFHCSLCHSIGRSYFDYCPYCGAKMSEIPTGAEGSEE